MNSCLLFLLPEYCMAQSQDPTIDIARYYHYVILCRKNLKAALGSLSMFMPLTLESTMALVLGVSEQVLTTLSPISCIH